MSSTGKMLMVVAVSWLLVAPPTVSASEWMTPARGALTMDARLSHPKLLAFGDRTAWIEVSVRATDDHAPRRLPLNIALVIDRSGSMAGKKMRDAKDAARRLAAMLEPDDRVSIVSYGTDVRVDLPSARLGSVGLSRVNRVIDRLVAAGNTNLSGGLQRGRDQVMPHVARDQVNRVLLVSDGIANVGITDTPQLNRLAREMAQRGVIVSTIGLGLDYNEDLMTSVADYGCGGYYYVRRSEELASTIQREAELMASTVAQRVSLELELKDGVDLLDLYGYSHHREGSTVIVPLPESFAGQERSVLVALRVRAVRDVELSVADVRLSWEDLTLPEPERLSTSARLVATGTGSAAEVEASVDHSVIARVEEIRIASAMHEAAQAIARGDRAAARRTLSKARDNATEANRGLGNAKLGAAISTMDGLLDDVDAPGAEAPKAFSKKAKAQSYELAR